VTFLLWLACGKGETQDSEPTGGLPFEPSSGRYAVTIATEFEGDCALDDPTTGFLVSDRWDLLIEGDKIRWWQNSETSRIGTMDGLDFSFDLGTYLTSYTKAGFDALESLAYALVGTFDSATSFSGSYDVAASCEGADCAKIGAFWGSDFTYPCVASAPFEGTAAD
jgi:hypothetical protein